MGDKFLLFHHLDAVSVQSQPVFGAEVRLNGDFLSPQRHRDTEKTLTVIAKTWSCTQATRGVATAR